MLKLVRIWFILPILVVVAACDSKSNPELLPRATGAPGEILLVIDSVQWRGPLGETIREVFMADVPGLPHDEKYFNLIPVHPSGRIELLTHMRNMIYVFTLDENSQGSRRIMQGFSPESLENIREDTTFFHTTARDVHSRGQVVMYLFGVNEQQLAQHIKTNAASLVAFFNNAERERLQQTIARTRTTRPLTEFLEKEYGVSLRFPHGYVVADQQPDFVWLRKIEQEIDKDVFVAFKPYESEYQLLPDSLVAWRDEVARKYLFADPSNPISYVITEREVPFLPVTARQTRLNDRYAMEIRGIWRTNNKSMGGPFAGIAVADTDGGMLYYIEGFTYSPSKAQREIMRELEAIVQTFRIVGNNTDNP
ncbi:MAG TPA: DUF4837 family protein [Cyclobacteriaceae bacterium]|nr:DUF4837 family protein [Cyclobacteriaceae bacterium]